ncbi:hypothetical protein OA492_02825 [Pelagibacteraceae bacterium]|nr:hypothetical protein [Pelagibacteraceae bacterium]
MKIHVTIFLLFFSCSVFADNISDFQIEGISVGDSLLNYFSEDEIKENTGYIYEEHGNKGKEIASFGTNKNLNKFDMVEFEFKTLNHMYEVASIKAYIYFEENIQECVKFQKKIFNDLKNLFPNKEYFEDGPFSHPGYPNNDVIILKRIGFFLNINKRSNIDIICFDISEKFNKKDRLSLTIRSDEYNDWIFELYK